MKNKKKEGLIAFSKNNFKALLVVFAIKIFSKLLLTLLAFLAVYSLFDYTFTANGFFISFIEPISEAKNLEPASLSAILLALWAYAFIMFLPLDLGFYLWFSQIDPGIAPPPLLLIFFYYKNLCLVIKAISFQFAILLRSALKFTFYIAPAAVIFIFLCLNIRTFSPESQLLFRVFILIAAFATFFGVFLFIRSQILRAFTKFVFVLNDSQNVFKSLKSSAFLTRNNSKEFMKFILSFWPYVIFSFFIITIPFARAYFLFRFAVFTKKIIYNQSQGIIAIPLNQKVIDINL